MDMQLRYYEHFACFVHSQVEACVKLVYNTGLNQYNLYGPCLVPKPDGYIYKDNTFIYDIPPFAFRNHPFMRQKLEVSDSNPVELLDTWLSVR